MKTPAARRPLWTCPKCGAKFVTRNMWHSCGLAAMADWDARMSPHAKTLFHRFREMIAACGPYHLAPAKTRIAILARVRFAGITAVSDTSITISFVLPKPIRSARFATIKEVAPGWWAHRIRVMETKQLDSQVQAWIRTSYRLFGMQERLAEKQARVR